MKKIVSFLLVMAVLFALCGCSTPAPAESQLPESSAAPVSSENSSSSDAPESEIFLDTEALYIRADSYGDDSFSALFPMENPGTMAISAVHHLPVLRFQTEADFTSRVKELKKTFQLDASYDEAGSFMEQTAVFDEAFFEENDLLAVYVYASSGSIRHEVVEASIAEGQCLILVEEIVPEVGTDDIAEWFILLPMPKEQLAGCTGFDAVLDGSSWYRQAES